MENLTDYVKTIIKLNVSKVDANKKNLDRTDLLTLLKDASNKNKLYSPSK
jgi:hypothetical protein